MAEEQSPPAPPAPPAPTPAQAAPQPPPTAPSPPSGNLADTINAVLNQRERENKQEERFKALEMEIAALKGAHTGKKRPWFSPLFD